MAKRTSAKHKRKINKLKEKAYSIASDDSSNTPTTTGEMFIKSSALIKYAYRELTPEQLSFVKRMQTLPRPTQRQKDYLDGLYKNHGIDMKMKADITKPIRKLPKAIAPERGIVRHEEKRQMNRRFSGS